jgi:DNA polymerase-1
MLNHISFGQGQKTLAILIPTKDLNAELILKHYITPLMELGIPREEIIAFNLEQNEKGKSPVSLIKAWLKTLKKAIEHLNIKNVLVCDASYFKTLAKVTKVEPHYGYPKISIWEGITCFASLNFRALFFNPNLQHKLNMSLEAVHRHVHNKSHMFENEILHDPLFPDTPKLIIDAVSKLHDHKVLTCDIEAYSLKVWKAGIATISFAWDKHTGVTFEVGKNKKIRNVLKDFFTNYQGKLIFHGSPYDCKVLIWELWMEHPRDYKGMLEGLHIMFRDLEDTKILAYLALNTTAQVSLSLKDLAFAYTGNYAMDDIADISKIPMPELLRYNMYDTAATWYVYDLYKQQVMEEQKFVYEEIFLPALKVITQMELCGIPVNLQQILRMEARCNDIYEEHLKYIMDSPIIHRFSHVLRIREAKKATAKLKKKVKTYLDFLDMQFNPNSGPQLAFLLHEHLELPILQTTDTKAPATDGKTLKALSERIRSNNDFPDEYAELLDHIIELHDVNKIITTFIPAFKNNTITKDGWAYLHGGFNLGGTKSGRLSSSDPNLTNIPSTGTQYAKPVKQCVQATPPYENDDGWLFIGADFFSLEDRISALQTSDPNKLKVYTDGYDGHCLRAFKYFGDKMPDIVDTVESINSIEEKYPKIRQASKSPTFLLTYMGTYHGLMKQFGFTEEEAKKIEADYHELYKVSDDWVMEQVEVASQVGYATLAFGLRLRTPIVEQVVFGSNSMPTAAHKEIKTIGNAHGQSYGLLNTRAGNEFQQRVWEHPEYRYQVMPAIQIHDSLYYAIRNNLHLLHWVNINLIECMEWNELPEIQHPTIKLGAALEVYYPDWSNPIKIPNKISRKELKQLLDEAVKEIHNEDN